MVFYFDICKYKIPNKIITLLLVLFLYHWYLNPLLYSWQEVAIIFLTTNIVMLLLFKFHIFAAGDGKFLSIILLFAGYKNLTTILIITGIIGGILAVIWNLTNTNFGNYLYYFINKYKITSIVPSCFKASIANGKKIPYGVSISIAALSLI